jgi:hypothetical protein
MLYGLLPARAQQIPDIFNLQEHHRHFAPATHVSIGQTLTREKITGRRRIQTNASQDHTPWIFNS